MIDNIKLLLDKLGYTFSEDMDGPFVSYLFADKITYVKNICNFNEVPKELEHVIEKMVVGEFLTHKIAINGLGDNFNYSEAVKSIQEGDVTVTYKDSGDYKAIFTATVSEMIETGKEELICFRKLKW